MIEDEGRPPQYNLQEHLPAVTLFFYEPVPRDEMILTNTDRRPFSPPRGVLMDKRNGFVAAPLVASPCCPIHPMTHSGLELLLSQVPQVRRFFRLFRDLVARVANLAFEVGDLKSAVINTQRSLEELQRASYAGAGHAPLPDVSPQPKPFGLDLGADTVTTREMQTSAAWHQPLLAGDLIVTESVIEVRGIAIAPNGLFDSLSFHINGVVCHDVTYPIEDAGVSALFSEIKGAAAFVARLERDKIAADTEFFRIDASPTGAFVPAHWRQANWFGNPAVERFPMPPAASMRRVIGDDHTARFSMGGATLFKKIENYLGEMGKSWRDFPRILDWGCGAGRLTRYLLSSPDADVTGADIDAGNIKWCAKNLTGGRFVVLDLAPPTPFGNGAFDLVIGCSVVTHLTEKMLFAWLEELQRITAPGALLFLSVSGAVQFTYLRIPPAIYRRTENEGFLDFARDGSLDGHIADENYYRSTWMSRDYIIRTWSAFFDVLAILDGVAALQDFVVLRRRA